MTPNQFVRKLHSAKKGDKIVYFRGYTGDLERYNDKLRREVARFYVVDAITMVQKRTGVSRKLVNLAATRLIHEYEYIAIKR